MPTVPPPFAFWRMPLSASVARLAEYSSATPAMMACMKRPCGVSSMFSEQEMSLAPAGFASTAVGMAGASIVVSSGRKRRLSKVNKGLGKRLRRQTQWVSVLAEVDVPPARFDEPQVTQAIGHGLSRYAKEVSQCVY